MQSRSPKAVGTPEMRFQRHLKIFVSMSKAFYQPLPPSQHCWLLLQGKLWALLCRDSSIGEEGATGNGGQTVAENPLSGFLSALPRGRLGEVTVGQEHIAWSIPVTAAAPKLRHSWPEGQSEGAQISLTQETLGTLCTSCRHRIEKRAPQKGGHQHRPGTLVVAPALRLYFAPG